MRLVFLRSITGLLTEGYAVFNALIMIIRCLAYFTEDMTWYYPKNEKPYSIHNPAGVPLLVPVIHRPDAVRPFWAQSGLRAGVLSAVCKTDAWTCWCHCWILFIPSEVFWVWIRQRMPWINEATVSSLLRIDKDERRVINQPLDNSQHVKHDPIYGTAKDSWRLQFCWWNGADNGRRDLSQTIRHLCWGYQG